jgi:hypothetical protein
MQSPNQITSLSCVIILLAAVGNAWGDRQITRDDGSEDSPQLVNQDGWGEEEQGDDSWTWFGMGYEYRTPGTGNIAATGARKSDN